ncbi:MAG: hypothetical protein DRI98_10680 [Bacteroidetes bacterium]|nr:MAG: hypothetical protein DRI98_10680 [Bacteroidota bacterium]
MITLTFEDLNKGAFTDALTRLSNEDGYATFKAAYNIAKILKTVDKELSTARDMHVKLLDKYAAKKEDGTFDVPEGNNVPYIIVPEKEDAYKTEMENFMHTAIDIECTPLKASELGTVRVTPADILALGDAFEIDEETI